MIYPSINVTINVSSGASVADAAFNYLTQYTNKVTHVAGTTSLEFDNEFSIKFPSNGIGRNLFLTLVRNDETTTTMPAGFGYWASGNQTATFRLMIIDNIFIFTMIRTGLAHEQGVHQIIWIKNGDNDFVTDVNHTDMTVNAIDITTTYLDANTDDTGNWTLQQLIPFSVATPNILYSNTAFLTNTANTVELLDNILSCSTITREIVITINGKNYYSVGTNFLVLIED